MSDIHQKLEDYLEDDDNLDDFLPDEDTDLMEKMMDFIETLNTENLTEDQVDEITDIVNQLADNKINFGEMDEVISAKKVKIKPSEKRARRMKYRRNRAKLKMKAKRFRRTTKFKRWKRQKERKARQGKTATGKRIRKFL